MENLKVALDKVLANELTAFLFVFSCAVGAFVGIAGGFYFLYQTAIYIGAY